MLKKCEVFMLCTDDKKAPIVFCDYIRKITENKSDILIKVGDFYNHLYFISDDVIVKGDVVYDHVSDGVFTVDIMEFVNQYNNSNEYSKVVLSTDTSLGLPKPSRGFILKYIKCYNSNNVITEAMVKYNDVKVCESLGNYDDNSIYVNGEVVNTFHHELTNVINSVVIKFTKPFDNNGEATISKVKDRYSRQEVYNLLKQSIERTTNSFISSDIEWINEVLDK